MSLPTHPSTDEHGFQRSQERYTKASGEGHELRATRTRHPGSGCEPASQAKRRCHAERDDQQHGAFR